MGENGQRAIITFWTTFSDKRLIVRRYMTSPSGENHVAAKYQSLYAIHITWCSLLWSTPSIHYLWAGWLSLTTARYLWSVSWCYFLLLHHPLGVWKVDMWWQNVPPLIRNPLPDLTLIIIAQTVSYCRDIQREGRRSIWYHKTEKISWDARYIFKIFPS